MNFVARNRKLVAIALIALSGLVWLVQTSSSPAAAAAARLPTGDAFVSKVCAGGDTVDYRLHEGATHGDPELNASSSDVASWFADRVDGKPATNTCT